MPNNTAGPLLPWELIDKVLGELRSHGNDPKDLSPTFEALSKSNTIVQRLALYHKLIHDENRLVVVLDPSKPLGRSPWMTSVLQILRSERRTISQTYHLTLRSPSRREMDANDLKPFSPVKTAMAIRIILGLLPELKSLTFENTYFHPGVERYITDLIAAGKVYPKLESLKLVGTQSDLDHKLLDLCPMTNLKGFYWQTQEHAPSLEFLRRSAPTLEKLRLNFWFSPVAQPHYLHEVSHIHFPRLHSLSVTSTFADEDDMMDGYNEFREAREAARLVGTGESEYPTPCLGDALHLEQAVSDFVYTLLMLSGDHSGGSIDARIRKSFKQHFHGATLPVPLPYWVNPSGGLTPTSNSLAPSAQPDSAKVSLTRFILRHGPQLVDLSFGSPRCADIINASLDDDRIKTHPQMFTPSRLTSLKIEVASLHSICIAAPDRLRAVFAGLETLSIHTYNLVPFNENLIPALNELVRAGGPGQPISTKLRKLTLRRGVCNSDEDEMETRAELLSLIGLSGEVFPRMQMLVCDVRDELGGVVTEDDVHLVMWTRFANKACQLHARDPEEAHEDEGEGAEDYEYTDNEDDEAYEGEYEDAAMEVDLHDTYRGNGGGGGGGRC